VSTAKKPGAAKLGSFSTFDGATPPVSPAAREETPADPPAPKPAAVRPAKPARTRTAAEAPAEMDKDVLDRWQWQLRATAGKAVAAQRRAQEAVQAWERLVADARHAGVPDRLPMAAALEADIDLPAGE
jgi:hypothetical protein